MNSSGMLRVDWDLPLTDTPIIAMVEEEISESQCVPLESLALLRHLSQFILALYCN